MGNVLKLIIGFGCLGIAVLLCLFSCIASSKSDKYWDELKKGIKKDGRN